MILEAGNISKACDLGQRVEEKNDDVSEDNVPFSILCAEEIDRARDVRYEKICLKRYIPSNGPAPRRTSISFVFNNTFSPVCCFSEGGGGVGAAPLPVSKRGENRVRNGFLGAGIVYPKLRGIL